MRMLTTIVLACGAGLLSSNAYGLYGLTTNVSVSTLDAPEAHITRERNGVRTLSDSTAFTNDNAGVDLFSTVTSSLADGAVRSHISGTGGPQGNSGNSLLISQGILFDEFTFVGSFSNQTVPFHATLYGVWSQNGAPVEYGIAQAQMKLFAAGTVPDNDNFMVVAADSSTPTLFTQTINGNESSIYPITLNGSTVLNGVNPKIQFYFNSQIIASSNNVDTDFDADFSHTSSVNFDFPQNAIVASSSGTFPGTVPATATPEPVMMLPMLAGALLMRRRRRA